MRCVLQRVKQAQVRAEGQVVGSIGGGLLVFLGIAREDTLVQADELAKKIIELRIFEDKAGKMNLSALQVGSEILVVSQFTLYGNCDKGRRPSFDQAAEPQQAQSLYEYFVQALKKKNVKVATGRFRAMMEVELVNDGPVTFILDT